MTEILTESFCERCGTRYTFESARPRVRLKGVKVLSRGLKNFVLSDDSSMDEAMATARNETDRDATSQQLDAFHKTFNFCMSCRQYTCPNCWNEAEARCLTCAPHLGHDVMPAPFPDLPATAFPMNGANGSNGAHDPWPIEGEAAALAGPSAAEEEIDIAARLDALIATTRVAPSVEAVPEVEVEAVTEVEATAAAEAEAVPEVEAIAAAEAEAVPEVEAIAAAEVAADADAYALIEAVADDEPPSVAVAAAQAVVEGSTEAEPASTAIPSSLPDAWIVKDATAEPGPVVDLPALASAASEPEPMTESVATDAASEPEPDPAIAARLAAMAAATVVIDASGNEPPRAEGQKSAGSAGALRRFRVGQNLDAELDAYERQEAADIATAGAGTAGAVVRVDPATLEPEVVAAEPEMAEAEPEMAEAQAVEATAAQPEPEPDLAAAAEPAVDPEPVVDDVVAQPTWRMVAPDPTAEATDTTAPSLPAAATLTPGGEPQWPTRPDWGPPAAGLPFLGRGAAPQGGLEVLWAESTREVVATPGAPGKPAAGGVQPCISCGLSLSGNARFCRRCGTPQAS